MYFYSRVIIKRWDMGWRRILEGPDSGGRIPLFPCEKSGDLVVVFDNEICFN